MKALPDTTRMLPTRSGLPNISSHFSRTLGIIGGTGAGKSTLVSLIMRFREVIHGDVSVMGKDVRKIKSSDLRKIIGYTPQKTELFSGTVRSNLLWGKPDASDEELISALKTAKAWYFVAAKQGLDTRVEAGGRNFSGGQRQRLTVARAIAAKPPIIILDDPSSALDAATDARLRAAIKRELADSAVIIVSQRVASVRNCDNILVLDGGKDKDRAATESCIANPRSTAKSAIPRTPRERRRFK